MSRVMVTGNLGYIGSVLTHRMQSAGHDVCGFDSGLFADCWVSGNRVDGVETLQKDIRECVPADFKGFDAVVHLAALSNDPLCDVDPVLTFNVNYRAAVRCAVMARRAGVKRFIFYSSCSVYGKTDGMVDEIGPVNPLTAYATAKLLAEREILDLYDDEFEPVVLRNATVFGYSPRQRLDLIIPDMVGTALTDGEVALRSAGTAQRPHVSLLDLCDLTIQLATEDNPLSAAPGAVFNVVGFNATVFEVASVVSETTGCAINQLSHNNDARDYLVDGGRAHRLLGFEPRFDLKRGVERLVQMFRTFSLRTDEQTRMMCVRLKRLQWLREQGKIDEQLGLV